MSFCTLTKTCFAIVSKAREQEQVDKADRAVLTTASADAQERELMHVNVKQHSHKQGLQMATSFNVATWVHKNAAQILATPDEEIVQLHLVLNLHLVRSGDQILECKVVQLDMSRCQKYFERVLWVTTSGLEKVERQVLRLHLHRLQLRLRQAQQEPVAQKANTPSETPTNPSSPNTNERTRSSPGWSPRASRRTRGAVDAARIWFGRASAFSPPPAAQQPTATSTSLEPPVTDLPSHAQKIGGVSMFPKPSHSKMFAIRQVAARSSLLPSLSRRAMSSSAADKKFYILRYEYVGDILERRGPFRAEHLERAVSAKKDGHVVMGGALVDPPDAGVFVFNVADKQLVEDFAKDDPYVLNDLVTSYSIREWTVVV
ncbi:hypothetical protein ON010_g9965 [Phytophthora cinnamomi]|nr:hypothetical protein ON010_g9965 [Phytophthora cinnamomi]